MVLAHGQNPSQRPSQTDSTNKGFGWSLSSLSNTSTLIGVFTWKRSGWSVIVFVEIGFEVSSSGGQGSGLACSDHSAVV